MEHVNTECFPIDFLASDAFGGMGMIYEEDADFTQELYQQLAKDLPSIPLQEESSSHNSDDVAKSYNEFALPAATSSERIRSGADEVFRASFVDFAGKKNSHSKSKRRSLSTGTTSEKSVALRQQTDDGPPPPPIVIAPSEVDNIPIQLEKNQQCACRDCGKLFNSVWYLKQHAVKHSNSRPFKCRFCLKTYKFRSNLYQHKCPNRPIVGPGVFGYGYAKRFYTRCNRSNSSGGATGSGRTVFGANAEAKNDSCEDKFGENSYLHSHQQQIAEFEETNAETPNTLAAVNLGSVPCASFNATISDVHSSIVAASLDTTSFFSEKTNAEGSGSIRERQLTDGYIETFIRQNKNKMIMCRKCKCAFPNREYFSRHTVFHDENEGALVCDKCPQRFDTQTELK